MGGNQCRTPLPLHACSPFFGSAAPLGQTPPGPARPLLHHRQPEGPQSSGSISAKEGATGRSGAGRGSSWWWADGRGLGVGREAVGLRGRPRQEKEGPAGRQGGPPAGGRFPRGLRPGPGDLPAAPPRRRHRSGLSSGAGLEPTRRTRRPGARTGSAATSPHAPLTARLARLATLSRPSCSAS